MGNKIQIESQPVLRGESPNINIDEKPYFDRVKTYLRNSYINNLYSDENLTNSLEMKSFKSNPTRPKDIQDISWLNYIGYANETIAYNPLVKGNISIARQNGVAEETNLTISGTIDLVDFGNVVNSIQEAKYRYKITDSSTWSNYTDITVSVDNEGNITFNDLIEGDTGDGFDIGHSYNIEVLISDELSTIVYTANLGSGIPNIALHKNGVGIMGKYDTNEGGLLQVAGRNMGHGIKTITGTITVQANINGSLDINYPDGFTDNNCVVVALGLKYHDNFGYNYFGIYHNSADILYGSFDGGINLLPNIIRLRVKNPLTDDVSLAYKIVLLKIS